MPVVGSRLKCERCREKVPPRQMSSERIRLYSGPEGQRLCHKHFHEAWDDHLDEEYNGDEC